MEPSGSATRRTLTEWVEALADEGPEGAGAWPQLLAAMASTHVQLADGLAGHLQDAERQHLLGLLLFMIARSVLRDWTTRNRMFDEAEAMGVHLLPVDYYSPVPNTRELGEHVWTTRWDDVPGFNWRTDEQLALLERLGHWAAEMHDTPLERPAGPPQYYFNNPRFAALDALVYYAMIREFAPRVVVEVGARYSTMVAARAARRNGTTKVRAIDPFPSEELRQGFPGLDALTVARVQDVDIGEFEALGPGDILFIGGTHVSKMDSDVNHLLLRVLPRLRPGVFVHIHDIYLPWDYPQHLLTERKRFWNEQYLVAAFLRFNEAFRVVWASRYLAHVAPDAVRRAFPHAPTLDGASLWLRRER